MRSLFLDPPAHPPLLRPEIEKYLRDTLEIHKSIKKIGIRIWVEVDEQSDGHTTVRDTSTLGTLLAMLEEKKKTLLKARVIKLTGHVISLSGPKTIKKASRPRGAARRVAPFVIIVRYPSASRDLRNEFRQDVSALRASFADDHCPGSDP